MSKISKKNIKEIEEFISLGCDYSGSEENLSDIVADVLEKCGCDFSADELTISDEEKDYCVLEDFVRQLYVKICEGFINVLETQE